MQIQNSANKIFILGTNGDLHFDSHAVAQDIIKGLGNNSGNLDFQKAVTELFANSINCLHFGPFKPYESCSDIKYLSEEYRPDVIVLPLANHIREGNNVSGLTRILNDTQVTKLIFGLGVQASNQDIDNPDV